MSAYRDPYAAVVARAEAAEARAAAAESALAQATARPATPARRWTVRGPGHGAIIGVTTGIAYSVATGSHGTLTQRAALGAVSLAVALVVWALLFLRRVPQDGGGR